MAAPGKRNGAQHVHDYVGNTSTNAELRTTTRSNAAEPRAPTVTRAPSSGRCCATSTARARTSGEDGGSLDGNVGSILKPTSAQLTFHGHGDEHGRGRCRPHLMMITGNAKAKVRRTATTSTPSTPAPDSRDRITDKYPICPCGLAAACASSTTRAAGTARTSSRRTAARTWSSRTTKGNCQDGFEPIPALRITLTYDQPTGTAVLDRLVPGQPARSDHRPLRLRERLVAGAGRRHCEVHQREADLYQRGRSVAIEKRCEMTTDLMDIKIEDYGSRRPSDAPSPVRETDAGARSPL